MTYQEKLEAIRKACVEANPKEPEEGDDPRLVLIRNIGLADVMLAVRANPRHISGLAEALEIMEKEGSLNEQHALLDKWDLRNDDLSKQPEETVDLIHGLLEGV